MIDNYRLAIGALQFFSFGTINGTRSRETRASSANSLCTARIDHIVTISHSYDFNQEKILRLRGQLLFVVPAFTIQPHQRSMLFAYY